MIEASRHVFISHAAEDREFVERISHDLQELGIATWVDRAQIRPGDDFIRKIEQGIARSSHVLIVLSPHSSASPWVREEINAAQIRSIRNETKIIPILLGAIEPDEVPPLLQSRLYVDFRDTSAYRRNLYHLMSAFEIAEEAGRLHQKGGPEASGPRIEALNVLRKSTPPVYALESLVTNPSSKCFCIQRAVIYYRGDKGIDYFCAPPKCTYRIKACLHPTAEGIESSPGGRLALTGLAYEPADDWGRAVTGCYVNDPYYLELNLGFPLYLELDPGESVLIRLAIDDIRMTFESQRGSRPFGEDHLPTLERDILSVVASAPMFGSCKSSSVTAVAFTDREGRHIAARMFNSEILGVLPSSRDFDSD